MHQLGDTRSVRRHDHAVFTPDTFVRAPLPGMKKAAAIIHAAPALGAGFTQYTAELDAEGCLGDLPASLRTMAPAALTTAGDTLSAGDGLPATFREAKEQVIVRFERQFIIDALSRHRGNISKAAEEMGMYRQHLQVKLAEYGIDAASYRK